LVKKLAFNPGLALRALALGAAFAATLTACTPLPVESDRLDSDTGTTVTLMPKPVELLVDRTRGPKADPFAYLAPFETNRMGSHELYLWISAPQVAETLGVPQVFCGEELIALETIDANMAPLGLSRVPYAMPAPWSRQWFFRLSGEVLDCFAGAKRIRVITQAGDAEPDKYAAEGAALSGLSVFASRVRT
jgi:hypothetical protein